MKINIGEFVLRDSDGSIDVAGTVQKFEDELLVYLAERETEEEQVSAAVHAVFDAHKGARINMPAVVSLALQHLSVTPATYQALSTKVQEYVRSNNGVLFTIAKGKGGGVSRNADEPLRG